MQLPYVGSTAAACRIAWDKPSAKAAVRAAGLRTPDWIALPEATFRELGAAPVLDRLVERFGLPLMVKPAEGGSALGVTRVTSADQLPNAMVGCFSYSRTALIERYVEGVEVAVTVLDDGSGARALPAIEIEAASGVFDYAARYTSGMTTYHAPARLNEVTAERLSAAAVRTHDVLGLRDISRFDAIVTAEGDIQFLEVNVAPGMTETSLFPMAVAAAGDDVARTCETLARRAIQRSNRIAANGH
jgi:D-alanine-D-alanine ligase